MLRRIVTALLAGVLMMALAACGSDGTADTDTADATGADTAAAEGGTITLGFSQVGAESGWRTANTISIQESAEAAGIDLKFSDAQQKQENQIKAIRSFIQQQVDVIAFSPVVESGWDTVLKEVQDAGIPVILTDRAVDSEDETLYETFLGSDFVLEGERSGEWLVEQFADSDETVRIVELQGTTGSAPANDRKAGFEAVISQDPKFEIIASQTGDFTRAKGKEVMEAFLKAHQDIDVLFAHNDDMGLGAIEAIEGAGLTPGEDILIITIDAVRDGMQALADGKINFIAECSPLLGPQLMELVQQVVAGEEVPKRIVTEETTFTQEEAIAALPDRQY